MTIVIATPSEKNNDFSNIVMTMFIAAYKKRYEIIFEYYKAIKKQ